MSVDAPHPDASGIDERIGWVIDLAGIEPRSSPPLEFLSQCLAAIVLGDAEGKKVVDRKRMNRVDDQ